MSSELSKSISLFSTCPQSKDEDRKSYRQKIIDVARWSEEAGCVGILVYTDNGLVDPWAVSQIILENTKTLAPLIAIQPVYMHPYTAAKKIATFAHLYQRRVFLNMLAGGFKNDLVALDDQTPHDDRYLRMVEYTLIIRELLTSTKPVSFEGKYYTVRQLKMTPALPPELFPGILSSGSSDAGMEAAKRIESVAIKYPKPPDEEKALTRVDGLEIGARVGIIARGSSDEAWAVAHERFPEDRKGQLAHQLAMKVSDSEWHKQLSTHGEDSRPSPYWLFPFKNYKTFCPYLVGSYGEVAGVLAQYLKLSHRSFVLDIPPSREELEHTEVAFRLAQRER